MTLRVLVVEDDPEIRALMQSSLSVEGFEVQTAVSLSEASCLGMNPEKSNLSSRSLGTSARQAVRIPAIEPPAIRPLESRTAGLESDSSSDIFRARSTTPRIIPPTKSGNVVESGR